MYFGQIANGSSFMSISLWAPHTSEFKSLKRLQPTYDGSVRRSVSLESFQRESEAGIPSHGRMNRVLAPGGHCGAVPSHGPSSISGGLAMFLNSDGADNHSNRHALSCPYIDTWRKLSP